MARSLGIDVAFSMLVGVSGNALEILVRELLLERTRDMDPPQLAAYIDGWSSLLDLVRRTRLTLPRADDDIHAAVAEMVERIRAAQSAALEDGTG